MTKARARLVKTNKGSCSVLESPLLGLGREGEEQLLKARRVAGAEREPLRREEREEKSV